MDKLELLPEMDKTFFIDDSEYKVCFINHERCRFSADPHSKIKNIPKVGDKFMIESKSYKVTYIHNTQKRITAQPLSIGY
jgi:hypothetical protein